MLSLRNVMFGSLYCPSGPYLKLDNSGNHIFGQISSKTSPKFVSNNTTNCFKTYLGTQLIYKQGKKKKLKAITVFKKEGGGSGEV